MSGKSKNPLGKKFLGLGISDDRHRPSDSKTGLREARQTDSSDSVMPPTVKAITGSVWPPNYVESSLCRDMQPTRVSARTFRRLATNRIVGMCIKSGKSKGSPHQAGRPYESAHEGDRVRTKHRIHGSRAPPGHYSPHHAMARAGQRQVEVGRSGAEVEGYAVGVAASASIVAMAWLGVGAAAPSGVAARREKAS